MNFSDKIKDVVDKKIFIVISLFLCVIILITFMIIRNKNKQDREELEVQAQSYFENFEKESIADENKKTNASFYQKLNMGSDVDILIIGDSIGAGVGTQTEGKQWFNQLKKHIEEKYTVRVNIKNISMSGTTSYSGYVRTMLLDYDKYIESKNNADKRVNYKQYDLAIICYGQNDAEYGFSTNYESIIRAVKKKYPSCSVISVLESSQRGETPKIKEIRNLCSYYAIPMVDTVAAFKGNHAELTSDGIHPNDKGQKVYFKSAASVIDELVEKNVSEGKLKPAVNKSVKKYENFVWYGVDNKKFKKITDTTYSAHITDAGVCGVYLTQTGANHGAKIYIDNNLVKTFNSSSLTTSEYENIIIADTNCVVRNEIRIEFESSAAAKKFKGICISSK